MGIVALAKLIWGGIMEVSLKLNKKHMPKEMPDIEQQEQLPPILIIYRDNDLFEKYVPEIARILQAKGRKVEIKNFPRNTEGDEIKEWYDENLERLAGMEIISDGTASVPYALNKFQKEKGIKDIADLDGLMNKTTKITIFGPYKTDSYGIGQPEAIRSEDQSDQLKKFFAVMVKRILENKENMPSKIYIFTDYILSHVDKVAYTGIAHEDQENSEVFQRKLEELKKTFPEELKGSLIESGIDAEKIIIKSEELNPYKENNEFQKIDQTGNWIIVDRHSNMLGLRAITKAKILYLPTESFYDSAREAGLIDIPEEEFSQNLEKVIDEKLGG